MVVPGVAEVCEKAGPVELALPTIDFRYFSLQVTEITLRKAPHYIEAAEGGDAGANTNLTQP